MLHIQEISVKDNGDDTVTIRIDFDDGNVKRLLMPRGLDRLFGAMLGPALTGGVFQDIPDAIELPESVDDF